MNRRFVALALSASVVLAACVPAMEQVSPESTQAWPSADASHSGDFRDSPAYSQALEWRSCGQLECATIQVPLDWSQPFGQTIDLALNRYRHPAQNEEDRLGTVLINPGGPGGSGLTLTESFSQFAGTSLLTHYDIVGFDPRGVGQSTPVSCGTDEELDAYYLADGSTATEADVAQQREANEAFAARCRELTGPLIGHVDTVSAARDMDVIRALVGDDTLNYLGFSYGTQLGSTYAEIYPEYVGRMVLDGMVDITVPGEEQARIQAQGFESALESYIDDCIASGNCPLPGDRDLAKKMIRDIILEARDEGIPASSGDINGTVAIYGVVVTLYDESSWPFLTEAFDEVLTSGTANLLRDFANFYLERDQFGSWETNSSEAFTAIQCADAGQGELWAVEDFRAFSALMEEASPTFGWWFGSSVGCEGWPYAANEVVTTLDAAGTAAPLVVIGTTGDPATPFEWSESVVEKLPNATLVIFEGEGHTAYGRSNQCIVDTIDAYFVEGDIPANRTTC